MLPPALCGKHSSILAGAARRLGSLRNLSPPNTAQSVSQSLSSDLPKAGSVGSPKNAACAKWLPACVVRSETNQGSSMPADSDSTIAWHRAQLKQLRQTLKDI